MASQHTPTAVIALNKAQLTRIYDDTLEQTIAQHARLLAPQMGSDDLLAQPKLLGEMELLFSGWGGPTLTKEVLDQAPNLKVLFYGAGAISGIMTQAAWDRNIRVCSAWAANAVPVAEYTFAMVILCLKKVFMNAHTSREQQKNVRLSDVQGVYNTKVGLVSMGMIGKLVAERLRTIDVDVVTYDPFLPDEQAKALGVQKVALAELFATCDVVSIHTPWLSETENMIDGKLVSSMKQGAAFINTSRGAVVNEEEVVPLMQSRQDLQFVLDVTYPEPPVKDSLIYQLPNVLYTPHIAGSLGKECVRMGAYMVDDFKRYLAGEPMKWEITREVAMNSTHRPAQ